MHYSWCHYNRVEFADWPRSPFARFSTTRSLYAHLLEGDPRCCQLSRNLALSRPALVVVFAVAVFDFHLVGFSLFGVLAGPRTLRTHSHTRTASQSHVGGQSRKALYEVSPSTVLVLRDGVSSARSPLGPFVGSMDGAGVAHASTTGPSWIAGVSR